MQVLDDADVARLLDAASAVEMARDALVAHARGRLAAPPRLRAEVDDGLELVVTAGGLRGGMSGLRAYRAGLPAGDQLVGVWDADGRLCGVVTGAELGVRRAGTLGAAVTVVVARAAVDAPAAAADGADILLSANRATAPVLDAGDVETGTHVVTVGPKSLTIHETPPELADRAALLTCDSPAQAAAYPEPFFTARPLVSAGDVLAGLHPGRAREDDITPHCSVGLAGSEVVMAHALLDP